MVSPVGTESGRRSFLCLRDCGWNAGGAAPAYSVWLRSSSPALHGRVAWIAGDAAPAYSVWLMLE